MVTENNALGISLTVGWVLLFLILSEGFARFNLLSMENARKLIHISVGNVIFFVPFYENRWIAASIPFAFTIGNYFLSPNSPIEKIKLKTFDAGHSWGTVYYPISLTLAVLIFFDNPQLLLAVFYPLVYGDGFAAVVGPRSNSKTFQLWGGEKSYSGTLAMLIASILSVFLGNLAFDAYLDDGITLSSIILLALVMSIVGTMVELLSPTGKDNLFIPTVLIVIVLLMDNFDLIGY